MSPKAFASLEPLKIVGEKLVGQTLVDWERRSFMTMSPVVEKPSPMDTDGYLFII